MKLHPVIVPCLNRCAKRLTIFALGNGVIANGHGKAVHKVEVRIRFYTVKQWMPLFHLHRVPAHVWQRQIAGLQQTDFAID
ncbi:Uncharacterised protein [Vibrio cholerae]|nr:Uncharacterised protein [Vibrio cholerae]